MGSCTLGVNDSLGDPLAIEVRKRLDEVEVLEEKAAANEIVAFSQLLTAIGLAVWSAIGSDVLDTRRISRVSKVVGGVGCPAEISPELLRLRLR